MFEKVVPLSGGTAETGLRGLSATSRFERKGSLGKQKNPNVTKKAPHFLSLL